MANLSSKFSQLGLSSSSSGGAGEINAVLNPSAVVDTTGWAVSGAGTPVVTRLTSGSPLDPITTTALRMSGGSAGAYVYYNFTLPNALVSKKLKIEWHQLAPISGDWRVEMWNQAGSVEYSLSTDSSGASLIPSVAGKFVTYFDADTTTTLQLRIVRVAGTGTLDATNIIVGPGIQPQGAVVEGWKSFTPTSNFTNCTHTGFYRRIGDSMQIAVRGIFTASPAAIGQISLNMPTGFTIDTSKVPSGASTSNAVGSAYARDSGVADYIGTVFTTSTTALTVTSGAGASDGWDESRPISWALNDSWSINATVPISEWAGSGTVNLGQNDVEYASNSGTWNTASDTSSFIYGPSGSTISSDLSQDSAKRVRFQTPIQPTDCIELEMDVADNGRWLPMIGCSSDTGTADRAVESSRRENTVNYGVSYQTVNSTDVDILFNRYFRANGATYGSTGDGWSVFSTSKWRVKKSSGGQAVGFGHVSQSQSGLVKSAGQLLGTNTNDNAVAGYVGEYVESVRSTLLNAAASGTYIEVGAVTLTAGDWDISALLFLDGAGAGGWIDGSFTMAISTTSASSSGTTFGKSLIYSATAGASNQVASASIPRFRVSLSTTTTYYLNGNTNYSSGNPDWYGMISARRMR